VDLLLELAQRHPQDPVVVEGQRRYLIERDPSNPNITQSVVTAGCGYLYVYIFSSILLSCVNFTPQT
jgi:hypothetical protein